MSYISSFIENDIISAIFLIISTLIFSYALGRIIQKKLKIFLDYHLLSFGLGFAFYWLFTFLFLAFFSLFDISIFGFQIIVFLELIFLTVVIIILWRSWIPSGSNFTSLTKISYLKIFISISFLILISWYFCYLVNASESFNNLTGEEEKMKLISSGVIAPNNMFELYLESNSELQSYYFYNQSFYIWVTVVIENSAIQLTFFFEYVLPLFVLILIWFLLIDLIFKNFNQITSWISIIPLIFGTIFFQTTLNPINGEYYFFYIFLLFTSLAYKYTQLKININNLLVPMILITTIPFFLSDSGLMFFLITNITLLFTIIRTQKELMNSSITMVISAYVIGLLFTVNISWIIFVSILIIGFVIILWLIKIKNSQKDIFLNKNHLNILTAFVILLISILISTILSFTIPSNGTVQYYDYFFNQITYSDQKIINETINGILIFSILFGPVLFGLISFIRKETENNHFFRIAAIFTILFFNPFSYLWLEQIFSLGTSISSIIIFMIPSLMLFIPKTIMLVEKRFKKL